MRNRQKVQFWVAEDSALSKALVKLDKGEKGPFVRLLAEEALVNHRNASNEDTIAVQVQNDEVLEELRSIRHLLERLVTRVEEGSLQVIQENNTTSPEENKSDEDEIATFLMDSINEILGS
ncbi:hypothetical protein F9B85_09970 [Heliorestis acidaminivorans]|uniref:Uncharacterized protein n=1 Tax=Heliorestis acidaminivorans TaxID=553427 RepID=A0A6I0F1T6_9FIRM|nr:hypothetical protein [Heliorestis acidaminivorans]KAB2952129.1 hypothetical protein F9B85_09970 [Heliorestis acidaminivorans]